MKIGAIKRNVAAVEQGRWMKDIPGLGDMEFLVRGTSNSAYRNRERAMLRALPPSERPGGFATADAQDRINAHCLADHALLDWKNVEDDAGPVAFDKETARTWMLDPEKKSFLDGVYLAASMVAEQDAGEEAAVAKNSAPPSVTG